MIKTLRNIQPKLRTPSILILVFTFTLISCKNEVKHDGYIITGKVKGLENGWIKLLEENFIARNGEKKVIDSTEIKNSSFKLKGKVENPDMVTVMLDAKYYSNFMLENCTMTLDFDVTKKKERSNNIVTKVTGSKLNDLYNIQTKKEDSLYKQEKYAVLVSLRTQMQQAYKSKDEKLMKKYRERSSKYDNLSKERNIERKKAKLSFVRQHPNSAVTPYVLGFQFGESRMTKEEMKEYYPLFQGDAKNTAMYRFYIKTYKEIFEKLAEGATAPDFTLPTLDGGTLTLSNVRAKYIFLDFWASWCGPCRASFPHLKEVYAKYQKDGFEVVAVCTADYGSNWKKAIEKDKTTWNHVFDGDPNAIGTGKSDYGKVTQMYGVPFLPTTFLLDGDGKILARQLRGKELDTKLEELYGY